MVNPASHGSGTTLLPWLVEPLTQALAVQRGHALLVHGSAGVGALEFVLALAQALLCESTRPVPGSPERLRPCGHCGSCRLVQAHLHPDLFVLLPETLRRTEGWLLADDKADSEDSKRKPSRQIRIPEVRSLIDWSQKTPARGRGKVAVLHPADSMNTHAASALLKTLEEPALDTRLLLTTADPARLLPTLRSRCQTLRLPTPESGLAQTWLKARGVEQPGVLLAACNGRPLDALALALTGVDAAAWSGLPRAVAHGQTGVLAGWPVSRLVDALQKLCHDAMARAVGGNAMYFPTDAVPATASLPALLGWSSELQRVARHAEHPWNEGLLLEAMISQGRQALAHAAPALPVGGQGFATLRR